MKMHFVSALVQFNGNEHVLMVKRKFKLRERSHMTSAAEGGGGFKMLTRGEGVYALLTSAKILKFWQKSFQIKQAYHYA